MPGFLAGLAMQGFAGGSSAPPYRRRHFTPFPIGLYYDIISNMPRLGNFDYKAPFYYMVTLKRLQGLTGFSVLSETGIETTAVTKRFISIIKAFHLKWRCCEEISPFVIMPDHIHLMMKIKEIPERVSLGVLVSQLAKELRNAYWEVIASGNRASLQIQGSAGASAPSVFERSWHDWIVKKEGQLAVFRRYIKENPSRAWQRHVNWRYFSSVAEVDFLGRRWFCYGNKAILDLPVLIPLKGHRSTAPGSEEWNEMIAIASRIGPGCAGVSTFMSPLEKACGNVIAKAGGNFIILSPEGFGPRYHPTRIKERYCAKGRMLFLSLYEAETRQPSRQTLYNRCHEMIDLVNDKLSR